MDDDYRYALSVESFTTGNLGIHQVIGDAPGAGGPADQPSTWQRQLAKLRELLTTNLDLVQVAWIRPAQRGTLSWGEIDSAYPLPGYAGVELYRDPSILDDHVPDAHGVQVVTSRHLARSHHLAESWYWTITDLGHDRHLIAATHDPHLGAWYQTVPYDLLLQEARDAFGGMIVTPELLQART